MPDSVFNWPSICFASFCINLHIHIHTYVCKCKSQELRETKVTQELKYKAWIQPQGFFNKPPLGSQ